MTWWEPRRSFLLEFPHFYVLQCTYVLMHYFEIELPFCRDSFKLSNKVIFYGNAFFLTNSIYWRRTKKRSSDTVIGKWYHKDLDFCAQNKISTCTISKCEYHYYHYYYLLNFDHVWIDMTEQSDRKKWFQFEKSLIKSVFMFLSCFQM